MRVDGAWNGAGGEKHDGHVLAAGKRPTSVQEVQAVRERHHEVQQDRIWEKPRHLIQPFTSILRLRTEGLNVVISDGGQVAFINEYQPELAVLDLMLPGVYGTEMADTLKSKWPDLPIIVVSALNEIVVAQDAWRSHAFAYFTKPFNVEDFIAAVQRALQPRRRSGWVLRSAVPGGPHPPAA